MECNNSMNKDWKRNASIFLLSQSLSHFGSAVVGFSVIWYITLSTERASLIGISIIASFIPQILLAPFAGVWADRYNKKMLIILADLLTAGATTILAVWFLLGNESLAMIFIISSIRSIGMGIQMPSVGAILPSIIPTSQLTRVNGINSTISSAVMLISPAIAGIMLAKFGFGITLLLDVITALIAVFVISFLPIVYDKLTEGRKKIGEGIMIDLKEGVSYAKEHPFIRRLLIIYSGFFFLITPAAFLTPVMIARSFGPEIWRLTANEIVWTIGAILGGIGIAILGSFKDKIKVLAISSLGFAISIILLGLAENFTFYLIIMLVAGVFMPYFSTAETVLLQENVEERMLCRVYSMIQIIVSSAMPLGMLLFGPLGDFCRIENLLIGTGIVIVLFVPYIWKTRISKEI